MNFLDEAVELKKAKAVILPVPFDGTASYLKGSRNGPKEILEASKHLEWFDEELKKTPAEAEIHTLDGLKVEGKKPEEVIGLVKEKVSELVSQKKFPLMLGGEHSITLGAVKAFKEKFSDLSVLVFDAHTDLREELNETRFSHGCVMKRINELEVKTAQLGIRNCSEEEFELIKEKKLHAQFLPEFNAEKALKELSENVYLSIDLDVLDPGIMPAVSTPEPGGISWQELVEAVRKVFSEKNVVGADIVELCPVPGLTAPNFLAAKLAYKLIGYKYFL